MSDPPLCRYVELIDGTLSLDDVAEMNEVLDVLEENGRRARAALAARRRK